MPACVKDKTSRVQGSQLHDLCLQNARLREAHAWCRAKNMGLETTITPYYYYYHYYYDSDSYSYCYHGCWSCCFAFLIAAMVCEYFRVFQYW